MGGKTARNHKTVQVPVSSRLASLIERHIELHHGSLIGDKALLFPCLNTWDPKLIDLRITSIAHIPYQRLLRGNRTRRHHVQLAHELHDQGQLEGTNLGELAERGDREPHL